MACEEGCTISFMISDFCWSQHISSHSRVLATLTAIPCPLRFLEWLAAANAVHCETRAPERASPSKWNPRTWNRYENSIILRQHLV